MVHKQNIFEKNAHISVIILESKIVYFEFKYEYGACSTTESELGMHTVVHKLCRNSH